MKDKIASKLAIRAGRFSAMVYANQEVPGCLLVETDMVCGVGYVTPGGGPTVNPTGSNGPSPLHRL